MKGMLVYCKGSITIGVSNPALEEVNASFKEDLLHKKMFDDAGPLRCTQSKLYIHSHKNSNMHSPYSIPPPSIFSKRIHTQGLIMIHVVPKRINGLRKICMSIMVLSEDIKPNIDHFLFIRCAIL